MSNTNEKPYVFVSYAHADKEIVMPTINAMTSNGINIWYDGGIEAGSEWPEYIAEKVISCTRFILFVSDNYLKSQNCKRELNFAISRKKEILSIYLHDVELSPGMEMQLGTYQAFFRNRFATNELFFHALCKEHFFDPCLLSGLGGKAGAQSSGTGTATAAGAGAGASAASGTNTASGGTAGGYGSNNAGYPGANGGYNGRNNGYPGANGGYNRGNNGYNGQPYPGNNGQGYNGGYNRGNGYNGQPYGGNNGYNGGYNGGTYQPPVYTPQNGPVYDTTRSALPVKNRIVAALLAIFLGVFGAHKFYLKKPFLGVLFIIGMFILPGIPAAIGFIEGVILLVQSDEKFEQKYKCRTK